MNLHLADFQGDTCFVTLLMVNFWYNKNVLVSVASLALTTEYCQLFFFFIFYLFFITCLFLIHTVYLKMNSLFYV
jgi:hypothetical protein